MTTKLGVYNQALLMMKERRLSSTNDDIESRRILDDWYTSTVQFCLEQGMWKFAMKYANLTNTGSGLYGFTYSFDKPSDFIHLFAASQNASFDPPLVHNFADEGSIFYANASHLYIRYSSNANNYGGNMSNWPQGFVNYLAAELAASTAYSITGNERVVMMLDQKAKTLLANCLSLYSLVGPPGLLPLNASARSTTAADAALLRPDLQPFGAEIKAMMVKGQGQ